MKWLIRLAAAAAVVLALYVVVGPRLVPDVGVAGDGEVAVVEYVYDGDTIRVTLDGAPTRVRLLNVDAPEEPRDGEAGECLAGEATAELGDLLPEGSTVTLAYDDVRYDQYGRLLAGVYTGDLLVNAELARAGLVRPVQFDGNVRFLAEVEAALDVAAAEGRGFFDPASGCDF